MKPPFSGSERPAGPASMQTPAASRSMRPGGEALDGMDAAGTTQHRRAAGARLVLAFYRLVKACQLYDTSNEAVQQLVPVAVQTVADYCGLFEVDSVRVTFARDRVFVNRRIMRATREVFALAMQLGGWMDACGFNELTIDRGIEGSSVLEVARLLVEAQRGPAALEALQECNVPGVAVRKAIGPDVDGTRESDESVVARAIKSYAASVLILRSFHLQLALGSTRGAHEVKRIAQKLVAISEVMPELLVSIASGALVDDEPARRAVSTAVIALSMTRFLTTERATLTTVVQAALLADSGAAWNGAPLEPELLATRTLGVLAVIGEFHKTSLRRSVVAYEALHPREANPRGSERPRTMLATLLHTARRFNEIRTPYPGVPPVSIDQTIAQLEAEAVQPIDQACARLLVRSLGLFPAGTMVELNTGEIALVLGAPAATADFARPPVQIMTDADKAMLAEPIDFDLAMQPEDPASRVVRRPLNIPKTTEVPDFED
ncbi:MAG: hypothetical protein HY898_02810 [Deltaproteobacteria bacterium]|nr:hypothetical protein [Deltaproteobacteria bacterium]